MERMVGVRERGQEVSFDLFNLSYLPGIQVEALSHSQISKSGVWKRGLVRRYKFGDVGVKIWRSSRK